MLYLDNSTQTSCSFLSQALTLIIPHPTADIMGFQQVITQIVAGTKYLVHPHALVNIDMIIEIELFKILIGFAN